jgi:hypothetical protein
LLVAVAVEHRTLRAIPAKAVEAVAVVVELTPVLVVLEVLVIMPAKQVLAHRPHHLIHLVDHTALPVTEVLIPAVAVAVWLYL